MATLSQTTQATRGILKWVGIAFILFLVLRLILFPVGKAIYTSLFPKEPPAPTTKFGTLPKIPFPQSTSPQNFTFTIQTTTGQLPPTCIFNTCAANENPTQPKNIPDRLAVYKVSQRHATFSSYDSAKQKVAALGFTGEGKALSDVVYQWDYSKGEGRQITFHTVTESFTLKTAFASQSGAFTQPPPAAAQAIRIAKDFLTKMSLLPQDIDDAKTDTTFLKLSNENFTKASSLSESELVQVDFYRKPVSDLLILYPDPNQSLLSFRIKSDLDRNLQVAEAHFAYKQIQTTGPSTYPIKTAQEAFDDLQSGNVYIAKAARGRSVAITKIYTAYYEGNDDIPYILPIFVFEGEGFLAFVEAIREEWRQ